MTPSCTAFAPESHARILTPLVVYLEHLKVACLASRGPPLARGVAQASVTLLLAVDKVRVYRMQIRAGAEYHHSYSVRLATCSP